jgi:predicted dehydrogenase
VGEPIRWGILGTGKIARIIAGALASSDDSVLVAVGSRDGGRAEAFAAEFGVPRAAGRYEAVIEEQDVDVVYVATYHPLHRELAVRAADAGKHVLCEKPLAVTLPDAEEIVEAARRNDVLLLEAFAYRCHPQTEKLVELVREGAIGEVAMIDAVFGYDAGPRPGNYLLDPSLGGGSILDVGCYTTSMAHLIAATAGGAVTPCREVTGAANIGETGVDLWAAATLTFEAGMLARVACAIRVGLESSLRVYGSRGRILVPSPWLPGRIDPHAGIVLERAGISPVVVDVPTERDVYVLEVDRVNAYVRGGVRSAPVMTWEESLENMRTLDRWRAAVGLRYPDDDHVVARGGRGHDR